MKNNKAARVRAYTSKNPNATPQEIAAHVGCTAAYASSLNRGSLTRRAQGTAKYRVVMAIDITCPIIDAGGIMDEVQETMRELSRSIDGEWYDAIIRSRRGDGRPDLKLYGTRVKGKT